MSKKLAVEQYICYYCNWVLKEEQIASHSCLNTYDKNEQVLVVDENRCVSIQDKQNYEFNKENDGKENYTENDTVENEVAKETSSDNVSPSINKQAIDEDLIYAVQKRPPLSLSPLSSGPSCRSTQSLERKKRSSGNYDDYDKIFLELLKKKSDPDPIDCFMMHLAEKMCRLPYRKRSKLKLEFLTRLNEVEEQKD